MRRHGPEACVKGANMNRMGRMLRRGVTAGALVLATLCSGCARPQVANAGLFTITETETPSRGAACGRLGLPHSHLLDLASRSRTARGARRAEWSVSDLPRKERPKQAGSLTPRRFSPPTSERRDDPHDDMQLLGGGTAFVMGDSATLWTNAHVVQNDPDLSQGDQVSCVLLDRERRIRFDSRLGRAQALLAQLGRSSDAGTTSHEGLEGVAQDLACIRIDRGLGAPALPIAAPTVGLEVFSLGYPKGDTGREVGFTRMNQLRYGRGRVLAGPPVSVLINGATVSKDDPDASRVLVWTSADGDHGQSGGPLIDSAGRVVGIIVAGIGYPDGAARTDPWGSIALRLRLDSSRD